LLTSEMAHLVNYLQPTTFRTFEISQSKFFFESLDFCQDLKIRKLKEKTDHTKCPHLSKQVL